jgi:Zn-dependent protease with chaperone function
VRHNRRRVESSAISALAPLVALLPVSLLALAAFWLVVHLAWAVPFVWFAVGYLACGILLFVRPVQVFLLTPLIGARHPTRDERVRLDTAWRSVLQAARQPPQRYVVVVLPTHELNAFACGGHLVVVTSLAIDSLPRDELCGVLAHELSHHLGLHTVALTFTQWLAVPVLVLARFGFFLQNVASAATSTFASHSPSLTALGRAVSVVLTAVSWAFLSGLIVSNAVGNVAGRPAEFQADERTVRMGFGHELSSALRRVTAAGQGGRPLTRRERLAATHPPARTRIARIDAMQRSRATQRA